MDEQEQRKLSARYAALELIEADLRDGNRIDAEVARQQLRALVEQGAPELGLGEVRAYCGPSGQPNVFGVTPDGDVLVPVAEGVLLASESGLWPALELEAPANSPRAMVS